MCSRLPQGTIPRRDSALWAVVGWGERMARLTVLMGAPGSGKSTYAKKLGNVVTTDGARERGQSPADALHGAYGTINRMLAAGQDVVFDTTGANPAVRKAAVTIARKHGAAVS